MDCKMIKMQSSLRPAVKSPPVLRESAQSEESRRAKAPKTVSFRWNHRGSIALKSRWKSLKTSSWIAFPFSLYGHRVLPKMCADLSLPSVQTSEVKGFFLFVAVAEEFLVLIFLLLGVWYDSKLTRSLLFFFFFLFSSHHLHVISPDISPNTYSVCFLC